MFLQKNVVYTEMPTPHRYVNRIGADNELLKR